MHLELVQEVDRVIDGNTQRKFNVNNVLEQLKKWSKNNVDFYKGNFDGQAFFNFPENDRAILTFDNNNYTTYYGLVYKELNNIELNRNYDKDMREKVIQDLEKILSSYNEEIPRFEKALSILDLKNVIGHVRQYAGRPPCGRTFPFTYWSFAAINQKC